MSVQKFSSNFEFQDCFAPWMRERRSTQGINLQKDKGKQILVFFALFSHIYFFVPAMRKKDIFTLQAMQFCLVILKISSVWQWAEPPVESSRERKEDDINLILKVRLFSILNRREINLHLSRKKISAGWISCMLVACATFWTWWVSIFVVGHTIFSGKRYDWK